MIGKLVELEPNDMPLTLSIGVASFDEDIFATAAQLFEAADAALYRAKQEGRNRVVVASPPVGSACDRGLQEERRRGAPVI